MESDKTIKVALVDDHEVVRMGLRTLLENQPDITVVGEAGTVQDAITLCAEKKPDIVVLDVRMPDGSGVEACRAIRDENAATQVIMLTSYSDDEALFSSIMAGAAGYLLKQTRSSALLDAIRTVARGGSLLDPAVTQQILDRLRSGQTKPDDPLAELTEQERNILEHIADGLTNREIAAKVFLSEKTVKHYVSNILSKLGVGNRAAAAALYGKIKRQQ